MSAAMDSDTDTVYVELLDEGTFVLRPTRGRRIAGLIYELLPTSDFDPEVETWRYAPGSIVECQWGIYQGEPVLVAKRLAS